MTDRRLIEETFPLQEVSEHSKHEKNVRHGHISTLHIWPARRPLAASRAAIIAALMPDPGDETERQKLNEKIVSITKWKTENGPALDYFREEIRKAYGGRPPRVLDMFAGGGAIPLEAMRLGCDVTAIDYNPVAWFILKCTLDFPQRLSGKTWPLPETLKEKGARSNQMSLDLAEPDRKQGDLADHVRYWGRWVLENAREELRPFYPTIDGQQTVAYLWARTVPCPDPKCGTIVPLLKTLWLSKKAEKTLPDTVENRARPDFIRIKTTKNTSKVVINGRRALRLIPPQRGEGGLVQYDIWTPGLKDKVPGGTMSGARTTCPCCGINIQKDYIKDCGHTGRLGAQNTAVVVDAGWGKEYRLPIASEIEAVERASANIPSVANQIPFGIPTEPMPGPETLGFRVPLYGFEVWADLFSPRQLLALMTFVKWTRATHEEMQQRDYPPEWLEAVTGYLAAIFNKLSDYCSTICIWELQAEELKHTFQRFALPITWDFAECNPITELGRYYLGGIDSNTRAIEKVLNATSSVGKPSVVNQSATDIIDAHVDLVVTDPPYYDAIPYADLSDFFYIWLRRILGDKYQEAFLQELAPKSDELVQQSRSERLDKAGYESGMALAFRNGWKALVPDGRMVIVFAHKDPEAWETLVTAMIQAGFTVTASWPIDTEMRGGVRNLNRASLASSIWMVCRKRPSEANIGRYRAVRKVMEERVTERLRYFWDIGLSGPDFVWAAIGPALESYSSYAEVKRLDGSPFTVSDFLKDVRRMVADFALGQILKGHSTEGLDEWTRYYLMHRNNFGLQNAPVGECILLSQGYGLDLNDLRGDRGFITKSTGSNVRLAKWDERTRDDLGDPHPNGGLPLIDMLHRLMRLWSAGNLDALNSYAAENGLRQNDLFWAVAQAVLEMAPAQSRERTLLEALVAWGRGKTASSAEILELPLTFSEGERDDLP
jgi:adenine-specific DNA methylase